MEAVNTETHENKKEFSKIFFTPNATRIETDVFEVTVQGEHSGPDRHAT